MARRIKYWYDTLLSYTCYRVEFYVFFVFYRLKDKKNAILQIYILSFNNLKEPGPSGRKCFCGEAACGYDVCGDMNILLYKLEPNGMKSEKHGAFK